jgi:hypothetical protein
MKFLQEITSLRLTEVQRLVLLSIFTSPTESLSKEFISGKLNLVEAAEFLLKYNLISQTPEGFITTERGKQELIQYNLIDESDQLTEDGQALLDASSDYSSYYTY